VRAAQRMSRKRNSFLNARATFPPPLPPAVSLSLSLSLTLSHAPEARSRAGRERGERRDSSQRGSRDSAIQFSDANHKSYDEESQEEPPAARLQSRLRAQGHNTLARLPRARARARRKMRRKRKKKEKDEKLCIFPASGRIWTTPESRRPERPFFFIPRVRFFQSQDRLRPATSQPGWRLRVSHALKRGKGNGDGTRVGTKESGGGPRSKTKRRQRAENRGRLSGEAATDRRPLPLSLSLSWTLDIPRVSSSTMSGSGCMRATNKDIAFHFR